MRTALLTAVVALLYAGSAAAQTTTEESTTTAPATTSVATTTEALPPPPVPLTCPQGRTAWRGRCVMSFERFKARRQELVRKWNNARRYIAKPYKAPGRWARAVWPPRREEHLARWRAKKRHARSVPTYRWYKAAARWSHTWAAECVSEGGHGTASTGEGGVGSATGNGYYGRWQADTSFASSYGPWRVLKRWGPYAYLRAGGYGWRRVDQDAMAYRGWLSRGWYPWPTTARACGLI